MSTSRLEKFIYAICSMEVSDLPAPLSRIEILWNCLITGETPDFEPQSRNEQYLMAMLGLYELDQLPTPLSRGEKLLYKIAMGETDLSDIPAYLSRYEELLGYLAENGGVGDFEYILQTLNQRLSTLYSTKERPMKQAVIKGDTLVNELPRPSLKNTMMNVASQKLNQGYDNGKTLVNLCESKLDEVFRSAYNGNKANRIASFMSMKNTIIKPNTKYLVKFRIKNYINESGSTIPLTSSDYHFNSNTVHVNGNGYYTISAISSSDMSNYGGMLIVKSNATLFENNTTTNISFTISEKMVIEYQQGMENWDIPYFEGTKTFSATPNVVDGEFKQAVVKGNTSFDVSYFNWLTGKYLDVNTGNLTTGSKAHKYIEDYFVIPNGTQTITLRGNNNYKKICYYNSNKEFIIGHNLSTTEFTDLTTEVPTGASYIRFNTSLTTQNTTMAPDDYFYVYLDNYLYLTNKEGYTLGARMISCELSEITTTGKNLHHGENMSNGYVATNGNIDRGNISNSLSDYIKVEPSTSYAYKCFVENQTSIYGEFAFYDKDKKFISVLYAHHTSDTCIITPDNCHYLRVWNNQYTNNGDSHPNAMLVKTTNLPSTLIYEPYQSNTLTLAEPVTLRKVGDVEDEFDALTGQVTERVGEVVLDGGNEYTWILHSSENTTTRFQSRNIPIPAELDDTKIPDVLCDTFKVVPNNTWRTDEEHVEIGRGEVLYEVNVRIAKTKLSSVTVDAFKEYLQSNPITLQYKLATESTKIVRTTITDQDGATQTKLHSFNDGHLSVSSQGLLPSVVNYEVPTNNSYYLPDMLTLGAQYTSRGSADCHATIDGKLLSLGKNRIFTTPSTLTNRLMVLDAPVDDLMFIKGDQTAKDFGYFEGMKSVEFSGVQVTGKNKFDGVSYIDGYIFGGGNTKVKPDSNVISILVNLEKNTDYIVSSKTSFDRGIVGGSMTPISINDYVDTIDCNKIGNTIRFNSGNYTYFIIYLNNGKIELTDLQVEKGSVVTPYEPYKSATLTLNEPVTLRKVGNVQDTLDGLTGEIVQNIGENVLDGVNQSYDSYSIHSANSNLRYIVGQVSNPCKFTGNYNRNTCVSDKISTDYGYAHLTDSDWGEGIALNGRHFKLVINLDRLSEDNLGGVKTYLSQNPITIQYELATPVVKTVDLTTVDQDGQPTKLKTFNDISYVEINADNIIPSVDVEVATKISETLAMLDPQHHDISNTQNELGQTIDEQAENTDATMMATTEIYEQTL